MRCDTYRSIKLSVMTVRSYLDGYCRTITKPRAEWRHVIWSLRRFPHLPIQWAKATNLGLVRPFVRSFDRWRAEKSESTPISPTLEVMARQWSIQGFTYFCCFFFLKQNSMWIKFSSILARVVFSAIFFLFYPIVAITMPEASCWSGKLLIIVAIDPHSVREVSGTRWHWDHVLPSCLTFSSIENLHLPYSILFWGESWDSFDGMSRHGTVPIWNLFYFEELIWMCCGRFTDKKWAKGKDKIDDEEVTFQRMVAKVSGSDLQFTSQTSFLAVILCCFLGIV